MGVLDGSRMVIRRGEATPRVPLSNEAEPADPMRGEKSLACGVFVQAIDDLSHPRFREAALNFLTSEDEDWVFSREGWASMAGIDPDVIREAVLNDEAGLAERVRKMNHRTKEKAA